MKNCIKCAAPLNDNDTFCPICGTEQKLMIYNQYCSSGGALLQSNTQYCPRCGKPVMNMQTQQQLKQSPPPLIEKLINRITMCAVFWLSIAIIQLIISTVCVGYLVLADVSDVIYLINSLAYGVVGIINIYAVVLYFRYRSQVLINYVGIVRKNKITFSIVIINLCNIYIIIDCLISKSIILTFLALLVITALLIEFISLREFIYKNQESFLQLERSQIPPTPINGYQTNYPY